MSQALSGQLPVLLERLGSLMKISPARMYLESAMFSFDLVDHYYQVTR